MDKGTPMSRQVIPTEEGKDIYLSPGFYRIMVEFTEKGRSQNLKIANETYEYAQDFVSGLYELSAVLQGSQVLYRISEPK